MQRHTMQRVQIEKKLIFDHKWWKTSQLCEISKQSPQKIFNLFPNQTKCNSWVQVDHSIYLT